MVDGVAEAGLPPAHVGLHAGPVIFQEGDYYGQTVNLASRIADYAQAGEVMVSQVVVDAAAGTADARYRDVGPIELKGVAGAMNLYAAIAGADSRGARQRRACDAAVTLPRRATPQDGRAGRGGFVHGHGWQRQTGGLCRASRDRGVCHSGTGKPPQRAPHRPGGGRHGSQAPDRGPDRRGS